MHCKPVQGCHCIRDVELKRHQCSPDHLSQNPKMWVRGAAKKVILNTHMELDMLSIRQTLSYCFEINHT